MLDESPDVTVIVAVRNGGDTLRRCLDSIVAQRDCRVELIVIDALSEDLTPSIVAGFADAVAHHIREPDSGIYDAWNKGVARATGRWCAFLGADDAFADEAALSRMVTVGSRSDDVVLVYGDVRVVGGPYEYVHSVEESDVQARLQRASMLPHPGAIHRVTAVQEAGGFDPDFRIAGDLDLALRLARLGPILRCSSVTTVVGAGGISARSSMQFRRHLERYRILRSSLRPPKAITRTLFDATPALVGQTVEAALIRVLGVPRGRRGANRFRRLLRRAPR